jgi:hypothetical protein
VAQKNMISMRDNQAVVQTHLQYLLLKAVRNDLQLDNSAKRTHFCVSMETLNTFVLLTATSTPAALQREQTVRFPWQLLLREHATIQRCMYRYAPLNDGDTFGEMRR